MLVRLKPLATVLLPPFFVGGFIALLLQGVAAPGPRYELAPAPPDKIWVLAIAPLVTATTLAGSWIWKRHKLLEAENYIVLLSTAILLTAFSGAVKHRLYVHAPESFVLNASLDSVLQDEVQRLRAARLPAVARRLRAVDSITRLLDTIPDSQLRKIKAMGFSDDIVLGLPRVDVFVQAISFKRRVPDVASARPIDLADQFLLVMQVRSGNGAFDEVRIDSRQMPESRPHLQSLLVDSVHAKRSDLVAVLRLWLSRETSGWS